MGLGPHRPAVLEAVGGPARRSVGPAAPAGGPGSPRRRRGGPAVTAGRRSAPSAAIGPAAARRGGRRPAGTGQAIRPPARLGRRSAPPRPDRQGQWPSSEPPGGRRGRPRSPGQRCDRLAGRPSRRKFAGQFRGGRALEPPSAAGRARPVAGRLAGPPEPAARRCRARARPVRPAWPGSSPGGGLAALQGLPALHSGARPAAAQTLPAHACDPPDPRV